jgi:hypothetical protein
MSVFDPYTIGNKLITIPEDALSKFPILKMVTTAPQNMLEKIPVFKRALELSPIGKKFEGAHNLLALYYLTDNYEDPLWNTWNKYIMPRPCSLVFTSFYNISNRSKKYDIYGQKTQETIELEELQKAQNEKEQKIFREKRGPLPVWWS